MIRVPLGVVSKAVTAEEQDGVMDLGVILATIVVS